MVVLVGLFILVNQELVELIKNKLFFYTCFRNSVLIFHGFPLFQVKI